MDLQRTARLWGPLVALGLVVPLLWTAFTLSVPDDRLATLEGAVVFEGTPVAQGEALSLQERVIEVRVALVIEGREGHNVSEGDTLSVLAPTFTRAGRTLIEHEGGSLELALRPFEKHDPDTGNTTWTGWLVEDAKAGALWASERIVLSNITRSLVPSLFGAVLVGYGLGLPRKLEWYRLLHAGPAVVGGLLLGLLLGALVASTHGPNALYPESADGISQPGGWAYFVAVLGVGSAAVRNRGLRKDGGQAAVFAGVGALSGLLFALLFGWSRVGSVAFAPGGALLLLSVFASIGALGIAAARYLTVRGARYVAAAVLVAPPLLLIAQESPFLGFALPLLVIGVGVARDLVLDD